MARSRKKIVSVNSLVHITWRCLNREFFLIDDIVKDYILSTWKRYCERYGVQIFEFAIMDNHVHLLAMVENAETLGNFMRLTNSRIALFINRHLSRDGHALQERYHSPQILSESYVVNTIGYIWFNRFRATGQKPEDYRYCSLFYRIRGIKLSYLQNYNNLPIASDAVRKPVKFVIDLLNSFKSRLSIFVPSVFEHKHTVGSDAEILQRSFSFRKPPAPA